MMNSPTTQDSEEFKNVKSLHMYYKERLAN